MGVAHRLVRAPGTVRLEVEALCTWRDAHGERFGDADPHLDPVAGGFVFERAHRVRGPGFDPTGVWYRGVRHRVEAERGLSDREDLWFAGRFRADLDPGQILEVEPWSGDLNQVPPAAAVIAVAARQRARAVAARCRPADRIDEALAVAADQFVVAGERVSRGTRGSATGRATR